MRLTIYTYYPHPNLILSYHFINIHGHLAGPFLHIEYDLSLNSSGIL